MVVALTRGGDNNRILGVDKRKPRSRLTQALQTTPVQSQRNKFRLRQANPYLVEERQPFILIVKGERKKREIRLRRSFMSVTCTG